MRRNEIQRLLLIFGTLTLLGCGGGSGGGSEVGVAGSDSADGGTDEPTVETPVEPTDGTGTTADVLCEYSQTVENADESVQDTSTADWFCSDDLRSLSANGLPDHEVGTFPNANNPTAISTQNIEVDFPLSPEIASETGAATMTVAYALNGVKFEVGTAGTCTDDGDCAANGGGG